MKKLFALLLALVMILGLAACGSTTQPSTSDSSNTTKPAEQTEAQEPAQETEASSEASTERGTFVMGDYVGSADPAASAYSWVGIRVGVTEPLFKLDDNLNVVPHLVKEYSVTADGLTWVIELRDDVTFQNGKVMDAEAVKASLERTCELQARAAGELKLASIVAEGFTLRISTTEPNPVLPNCMCDPYSCIVDVTETGADGSCQVGTGPFKLVEYVENERMELDAYDGYWAGVPASKHVTIRAISDLDASSLALQKGELDACYGLSYDARDLFDGVAGFKISQAATARVYMCYFNLDHELTGDPAFREAVCMAIDREGYASVLVNGAGTPTKNTFPESASFGKDSAVSNVPDYDMEAAAQKLAEAGYVDTDGDGILEKDGKKVEIQIITYGRTGLPQSGQALQSALKQLGIDASFEQLDGVDDRCNAGTFDIAVYAQVTLPTGDPYSYCMNNYKTGGTLNHSHISDPELDALIDQLGVEFDTNKRSELATEIVQSVLADYKVCNMYHLNMYMAMKEGVEGLTQSPVDYYHITWETCVK